MLRLILETAYHMGSLNMGSLNQLRFGQLVGDSLGGLDPVVGALLSPTGGIPGGGNFEISSKAYWLVDKEVVMYHGIAHDAAGYLSNYQGTGPGYQ